MQPKNLTFLITYLCQNDINIPWVVIFLTAVN